MNSSLTSIFQVTCFIILQFICWISNGQQNLVNNSSFEDYWYCPPVISQDSFPCKYWWPPNLSTPDYFNPCSYDANLSTPNNVAGFTKAHTGNSYIGIGLIGTETAFIEHIQSKLKEPLKQGKRYKFSFWVKLAYQSSDYITYNIGAFFSPTKILKSEIWESKDNYIASITPELSAHVSNKIGEYLKDTTWTEISGEFTAQGGEIYLTIGVFWESNYKVIAAYEKSRSKDPLGNNPKSFCRAIKKYQLKVNPFLEPKYINAPSKLGQKFPYYFIDDVWLEELSN
jgi:hypothetical protein